MRQYILFVLILALATAITIPAAAQVQIYSNDFEDSSPIGPEWTLLGSAPSTDTTPGTSQHPADTFLGQLSNDTLSLTLHNLHPAHTTVSLSFDLYIIRSWDGNFSTDERGPDFWGIDEGPIPTDPEDWEFVTTFSNWNPAVSNDPHQAFPDAYGTGDYLPRTGTIENNTLGYQWNTYDMDAVYHIDVIDRPHTGADLTFSFGAQHLQDLADESWGIDNVQVSINVPEPATIGLLVIGAVPLILYRRNRR